MFSLDDLKRILQDMEEDGGFDGPDEPGDTMDSLIKVMLMFDWVRKSKTKENWYELTLTGHWILFLRRKEKQL